MSMVEGLIVQEESFSARGPDRCRPPEREQLA